MQNLPIKFPNKKGILVSTPTLLKYMSLFLNKFKLGFGSDTYLPFGPKSRFLQFFFLMSSLSIVEDLRYKKGLENIDSTFLAIMNGYGDLEETLRY